MLKRLVRRKQEQLRQLFYNGLRLLSVFPLLFVLVFDFLFRFVLPLRWRDRFRRIGRRFGHRTPGRDPTRGHVWTDAQIEEKGVKLPMPSVFLAGVRVD